MKSVIHCLSKIVLIALLALYSSTQATAEIDMRFWNEPGYFDNYYQDLGLIEAAIPTILKEEDEVLKAFQDKSKTSDAAALAYLKSQMKPDSSSALYYMLAIQYYKAQKLEESIKNFKIAVKKWPTFQPAYKFIGYAYMQLENWDEAGKAVSKSTELGDNDARTYGILALIYLNQDKIMEAETAYKNAIIADPNTLDWYKGLAQTLLMQGKHLESISLFEEIITNFDAFKNVGEDSRDYYLLLQANSFVALDMQMSAASNYELVKRMGKENANSMGSLGDIYVNANRVELATSAYIESIQLDYPEAKAEEGRDYDFETAMLYATVMTQRGYWKNADSVISTIRSVYKDELPEENHLSLLRLEAQSAIALQKDPTMTIALLEDILELDPNDGRSVLLLAEFQHSESVRQAAAGLAEESVASLEESRRYFDQAITFEDEEFLEQALLKYGQMLVREHLYCDAVVYIEMSLDINYTATIEDYLERVERACRNQRIGSR